MATVRETDSPLILESTKLQMSLKRREVIPYIFYGVAAMYLLVMRSFEGIAAMIMLFGLLYQNKLWTQKRKMALFHIEATTETEGVSILRDLPDDCFLINNALLPLRNGKSLEINHVVLTRSGIFVIECVDAAGRVEGSADLVTKEWKQIVRTSTGKEITRSIKNPVVRVANRANRLREYLMQKGIRTIPAIHSIVLFTNKKVNLRIAKRGSIPVAMRDDVGLHIQKVPPIYTDDQLNKVLPILWDLPIPNAPKRNQYVPLVNGITLLGAYAYAAVLFFVIDLLSSMGYGNFGSNADWGAIFRQTSTAFLFTANIAAVVYAIKMFITYKRESN